MNELYIHIGLHKSGTTYLQEEAFPRFTEVNFIHKDEIAPILKQIAIHDASIFDINDVKKKLATFLVNEKNLISAESLSGHPFLQYINRSSILKKIHDIFPNAKIIICIRSQVDILISLYKHFVKGGGIKRMNDFINPPMVFPKRPYEYLNIELFKYSGYLRQIEKFFGLKNVHVCVYENLAKNPKGFINSLMEFLKINKIPEISYKPRNISPSDSEIYIRWLLNRFFKSSRNEYGIPKPPGFNNIINLLTRLIDKKDRFIMPVMLKKTLKSYYREDNYLIDQRYQLGLEQDHNEKYF